MQSPGYPSLSEGSSQLLSGESTRHATDRASHIIKSLACILLIFLKALVLKNDGVFYDGDFETHFSELTRFGDSAAGFECAGHGSEDDPY